MLHEPILPEGADNGMQARYAHTRDVLEKALVDKAHGEIAVVSSFGAESAVLLQLVGFGPER